MKSKIPKLKGEADYDYKHDILFFKTKDAEYERSIEVDNIVFDIDSKGRIAGIQIFEASKFFNTDKLKLKDVPNWEFNSKVEQVEEQGKTITRIEVRLIFMIRVRNQLIEKNPIIMQPITERLPNSELACVA